MKRLTATALLFVMVKLIPAALAQDAETVLENARRVMNLEDLHSFQYSATGSAYAIGQSWSAGMPYPRANLDFLRDFDLETFTVRQTFARTAMELQGGGPFPGTQQYQEQFISRNSPWPAHVFMWLNPPGFIRGATIYGATASRENIDGSSYHILTSQVNDRYTVRGYFNDNYILERVESSLDVASVLGDAPLDAIFSDYRDFNGVLFPRHILHHMGLQASFEFFVTDLQANIPVSTQPPQQGAPAGTANGTGNNVEMFNVGDGIYHVRGGTHHSVAVEFSDFIVVVEAPLNEERSLAVMAEIARQIPGKAIRYVVNTHHHFDHANGLRAYAAAGATIVTHPLNRAFYEEWWAKPRELMQDQLSQSGEPAHFASVSEGFEISDGERSMEIHPVRDNQHAEGMLMAYLPGDEVLVVADIFTPAATADNSTDIARRLAALNLVENIEWLELDVEVILPLHGSRSANLAELYRLAGVDR